MKLMANGVLDKLCGMGVSVFVPVVAGVEELSPRRWTNPVFGSILEGEHEALGGSFGLRLAGFPFFHVATVLVGTSGLMTTCRLAPLPWAAHGCSCSRYCSAREIQSAHFCARALGGLPYNSTSKAWDWYVVQGLKPMSGVAGKGGKYWICRYSLVAASMLILSVRRAWGLHGTAQSVVKAVAPARVLCMRA